MEKCTGWHKVCSHITGTGMTLPYTRYECWGTKEREECKCGGDPTRCDFYPEKREETKTPMTTAEMWVAAQNNNKTYCSGDMAYSAEKGFYDPINEIPWPLSAFTTFDEFMDSEWYERIITRAEAEALLGATIVD